MSPIVRESYRVPRGDREVYLHPAASDIVPLVARNRRRIASYAFDFAGRPIGEFRAAARSECLALARRHTEQRGFAATPWSEPMPVIMTGHQPQPFHPGVWFKNFLAGNLASAVGGAAVNLAVDNDEVHPQGFRFPTGRTSRGGEADGVRTAEVPFAAAASVPFEEQPASALRREAADEILPLLPLPCAEPFQRFWRYLVEAASGASSLGEAVAAARCRLEAEVGLANLEVPVSRLADSDAFRWFFAAMLARHEDLFAAYNESLAEFRRVYHERSAAQPVPDLVRDGRRAELPYWAWRAGQKRRRLWVEKGTDGDLHLAADRDPIGFLRGADLSAPSVVAAHLAKWRREGWKIRPRAITLTLFVHLCLGDVFIHGVGGALYDKVTGAIFERLFAVPPPELVLASCAVHLPLQAHPATARDLEAARRAVRDWRFNPDRLLAEEKRRRPDVRALVDEKRRLIEPRGPSREARQRAFRRIHEIDEALVQFEPGGPAAARQHMDEMRRQRRENAILQNREYPFCLYAAEALAAFYRQAARVG